MPNSISGRGENYMYLFKKIISRFLMPTQLCIEILVAGLVLLWFTKRKKAGTILITLALFLVTTFSYGVVSNSILWPLEYKYLPLTITQSPVDSSPDIAKSVKWIVVLSGGGTFEQKLPLTSQLSAVSCIRVIEGVSLYRIIDESKLIFTGGGEVNKPSTAELMAQLAISLGVAEQDIVLETRSRDTKDHAIYLKSLVKGDKFILVTSASHMLRSVAVFEKLGMHPIPAPVGHLAKHPEGINYNMFFPSSRSLDNSETAMHEYLGLLWAKLRGQI